MEMNTVALGVSNFHFLFRILLFTFSFRLIQQVIHTEHGGPLLFMNGMRQKGVVRHHVKRSRWRVLKRMNERREKKK